MSYCPGIDQGVFERGCTHAGACALLERIPDVVLDTTDESNGRCRKVLKDNRVAAGTC